MQSIPMQQGVLQRTLVHSPAIFGFSSASALSAAAAAGGGEAAAATPSANVRLSSAMALRGDANGCRRLE